jgi:hypothetical protein
MYGKLVAGFVFASAMTLGPGILVLAQTDECPTCTQLNSQPDGGGPGFFDWTPNCDKTTGKLTIGVAITTRGESGIFRATVAGVVQEFSGNSSMLFSVAQGQTVERSMQRPDGSYVIPPKQVVWNCPCVQTVVVTTTIPRQVTTTAASGTSIPNNTTVPHSSPTTVAGSLPATGPPGIYVLMLAIGLIIAFLGWIAYQEGSDRKSASER